MESVHGTILDKLVRQLTKTQMLLIHLDVSGLVPAKIDFIYSMLSMVNSDKSYTKF